MFERYTDRARRVIVLAQENARMLNHAYIGTEHLLLGLLHEDGGVARKALDSLGITLDAARQQVEQRVGLGQQGPSGHIPFTPRTKTVLELGLREAIQFGHSYIGTEHLLLGLARESEGIGASVLVALGAPLDAVRARVLELLGSYEGAKPTVTGPGVIYSAPRTQESYLAEICARLAVIEKQLGIGSESADAA
jgi:ATP-dependent Clp protease ATP-binding subunit ClpC